MTIEMHKKETSAKLAALVEKLRTFDFSNTEFMSILKSRRTEADARFENERRNVLAAEMECRNVRISI